MTAARLKLVDSAPIVRILPHDPGRRGLVVVYRRGHINFCPGCSLSNWSLGRKSAECNGCGTALDFAEAGR